MKVHFLPFTLIAALSVATAQADSEPVTLTSTAGKSLVARLRSLDSGKITVIRDDKKIFEMPVTSLDEKSQAIIKDWEDKGGNLSYKFNAEVDTGITRKTTGSEDFDDQRVTLNPTIVIKNPDIHRKTVAAKVTAVFLGRPVDNASKLYVFKAQTFDLAQLDPLGTTKFTVEKISQAYDRRGYGKFGARYIGYALLVHDTEGTIHLIQSIPSNIADNSRELLNLKSETTYGKNLVEAK